MSRKHALFQIGPCLDQFDIGSKDGAFRVGDLLNGMLPGFGKSVDPGNAAKEIAPGFMEPQLPGSGTDMLGMLGMLGG